ncbi:MAG TPA: hypothetical protein VLB87_01010 [Pyrinomonadaceae bacterium]|nr:hypothetical protein [Pyrinomonadaceae bacterium]
MISQRNRFLFPCLVVLFFVNTARAHEGPPYPLFVDQTVGSYVVSLWSDPDVGDAPFYVILNNQQSGLPPDLRVQIGVQPVNGRLPEAFYPAERESVQNQVQYKALVHFDAQELWRVRVRLESASGSAETTTQVEATPPGYGRWDLLVYLVPFLAVGIVWGVAMVRKFRQRTGDKHA